MPSKGAYLLSFLIVAVLSIGMHMAIFRRLKKLFLQDFTKIGPKLVITARVFFIYFDLPFLFLFVRRWIDEDVSELTRFLLYPFVVWQFLLVVWGVTILALWLGKQIRRRVNVQFSLK